MYAILDIETTGGQTSSDSMVEIAIILCDGWKRGQSFHSLLRPHRRLPYRVSARTGITDRMVQDAPAFYEIAKEIVEMTEGCTLVGHNVRHSYQFLREAFKSLGFDYRRKWLCTVDMTRSLVPELRSYHLSHLLRDLEVRGRVRYRAQHDVELVLKLFRKLHRMQKQADATVESSRLGPEAKLHKAQIDQLPQSPGVYYFYNQEHQLIYVGKSVNIRSRVLSHFANYSTKRALEMKRAIDHIRCQETGSELIALLKESEEIKRYKPIYNRAQRRSTFQVGLFTELDAEGYLCFRVERLRRDGPEPVAAFATRASAKGFLERMLEQQELCQTKCGLHQMRGPCFYRSLHKCLGACVGEETAADYNLRAEEAVRQVQYVHQNILIIDRGRTEEEKAIVVVENGKYLGYGYLETELIRNDISLLKDCVQAYADNKDVRQIINLYLRQEKAEEVIYF